MNRTWISRLPHLAATPSCCLSRKSAPQMRQFQLRTLRQFHQNTASSSPRLVQQRRPCLFSSGTGFSALKQKKRQLVTLAIETSCDDTCVTILEKFPNGTAHLHFNKKATADNREHAGIHPVASVQAHSRKLAPLIKSALFSLPRPEKGDEGSHKVVWVTKDEPRLKPDFISVTRGPGMMSSLFTGLNMAKGLAIAWDVPVLGVNHMQAHAITPHLVNALEKGKSLDDGTAADSYCEKEPAFPYMSLLVSGGHSMVVKSRSLHDHAILAESNHSALGNMLDKSARMILPKSVIDSAHNVMYGRMLEKFAFEGDQQEGGNNNERRSKYGWYKPALRRYDETVSFESKEYGWALHPSMSKSSAMSYEFAGFVGQVELLLEKRRKKLQEERGTEEATEGLNDLEIMPIPERRELARHVMRMGFEHLASRLIMALQDIRDYRERAYKRITKGRGSNKTDRSRYYGNSKGYWGNKKRDNQTFVDPLLEIDGVESEPRHLVVSGGVASNEFLMLVLRSTLDVRGFGHVQVIAPPPELCVDNAAMIAWLGMEMYEEDPDRSTALSALGIAKWPIEQDQILGMDGWVTKREEEKEKMRGIDGWVTKEEEKKNMRVLDGWVPKREEEEKEKMPVKKAWGEDPWAKSNTVMK